MAVTSAVPTTTSSDETRGMLLGLVGVAMFSLTVPFTRMAVAELDPVFIALGRAVAAAVLAGAWLAWRRAPLPGKAALPQLAAVAAGCIVGFPLLSSIALRSVPASHAAVVGGILPLATALYSALRGYDRPSRGFWAMAVLGSALVVAFAMLQGGGQLQAADLLMFGAVASAAIGYAEGGKLARTLGGQETICWALVMAAPVLAPVVLLFSDSQVGDLIQASSRTWIAFGYVTAFSMFIAFFFWYRGLALGGVARVGQVQLLQAFLSILGAAILLGEPITVTTCGFALAVVATVFAGRRMQIKR